jgi:ORF005
MDKEELKLKNNEELEETTDKMKEIFKEAHDIFLNIMECDKFKFKYLPQSLLFKAKQFNKEVQGASPKRFPKFSRGTIVYVKFGINIGAEMSGNHFAIVLDKYDKETKSTITVVPLSSKEKKYYQKLLPYDNIYGKNLEYHINKLEKLNTEWKKRSEKLFLEIDGKREYYSNEYMNYIIKLLSENNGVSTDDIKKEAKLFAEELIKQTFTDFDKARKEILNSKDEHVKGIEKYQKYKGKDSYACINMIQTIDKRKLTPISIFESVGEISVSKESMNLIEDRIRKIYFTFDK